MAAKSAYEAPVQEICELFADYLDGASDRPALAVSCRKLNGDSRNAIEKSLEAFGYAPEPCTFATLFPCDAATEGGDIPLDPQALFLLTEGLDPLLVIATDEQATAALAQAYRTGYAPDSPARVFGRPAVMFANLENMLQTQAGKQRAWKLLKTLAR